MVCRGRNVERLAQAWKSVKMRLETYEKVINLKAKAELKSKDNVPISRMMDEIVDLAIQHVESGAAWWGKKSRT